MSRATPTAFALILCASAVWAQEPDPEAALPVGMDVRLGFAEKIPPNGFTPVLVDLRARERDHADVMIRFRSDESSTPILELGPVSLTAGRTRRVRGIAPAKSWLSTGVLLVRAEGPAGEILGEAIVGPDSSSDRLLLILDQHGAAPADFSLLQTEIIDNKGKPRYLPWTTGLVSSVDDLPVSPLGYSGASAILLGDLDLERWSEAQASALAGWVTHGGHLLISVGNRGMLLKQSLVGKRLAEGLGALPHDTQPVPGSDVSLGALLGNFGPTEELETIRPPYSAVLRPSESDRVLLRDDLRPRGRPFAVSRGHGRGQVTLIASDLWSPPFLHAQHTREMMEFLVRGGWRYSNRTRFLFQELAAVRQPAQVGPAFAVLIIYALIAGPGVYFLLRAKKRGILLWVVIPLLTLGFTALVPFYRLVLKDAESTLVGVRLIEMRSGRATSVETADALIFSGSLDTKHLALEGDDATAHAVIPPRRMRRRGAPQEGAVLGTAGPGGLEFDLPVALWGTRYISFARSWKAPKVDGQVRISASDLGRKRVEATIEVDYQGAYPLENPVVIYPSRIGALVHEIDGPLRAGAPYGRTVSSFDPAGSYECSDKSLGGLMITRLVQRPYKRYVDYTGGAYLIGWTNAPFPVKAKPNVRTRASATLMVIGLPVRYRDGVPHGAVTPTWESSTVAQVNSSTVTREVRTQFDLPGARRNRVTRLELALGAQRGSVLTVGGLQVEGEYRGEDGSMSRRAISISSDSVQRSDSGRRITLELPDPANWVTVDGEVIIYQRFDRPRMEEDRNYSAIVTVSARWDEETAEAPSNEGSGDPGHGPGEPGDPGGG